jgi:hypothetical protein
MGVNFKFVICVKNQIKEETYQKIIINKIRKTNEIE